MRLLMEAPAVRERRSCTERGAALLTCLMTLLLLSAIGSALVLSATADLLIASNAGAASEAQAAARAALARTAAELALAPTLSAVLNGSWPSQFVDGASAGTRTGPAGSTLNLDEVLTLATCGSRRPCSSSAMDAVSPARPWGPGNPRWRLFSYGLMDGQTSLGNRGAPLYVVSMVADDPADADGNPSLDGVVLGAAPDPGAGLVLVRAEAFGRRAAHAAVEALVLRRDLQAMAVWAAADPLTRGAQPPVLPELQVLSRMEVR